MGCGFGVVWNVNEVCSETWDTLSYGPPPEVQPYRSCVKPPPDFSSVPTPSRSDCVLSYIRLVRFNILEVLKLTVSTVLNCNK